jgi:Uncharacterized protein conserved in bacteria (DUF2169)
VKVVKVNNRRDSTVDSFTPLDGRHYLGVVGKRAYRFRPGGRAEMLPDPVDIHAEPAYAKSESAPGMERLVHDSDLLSFCKPLTDVLVRGCAYGVRGAVTCVETGIQIGRARKAVRAWGDRRIERRPDGSLGFSVAEPFTRLPLTWDLSYGGRDQHAEKALLRRGEPSALGPAAWDAASIPWEALPGVMTYPRNYAGRGFFIDVDPDRMLGTLVPNLDDASDPVEPARMTARDPFDWLDRPAAACYEPIDWFTFPRVAFAVAPEAHPPKRRVHEIALGGLLQEDLEKRGALGPTNARIYNCAPAGLAVCRLVGGERVSLWNLHAMHALLEFDLPGERPRMLIEPPGAGTRELDPLLQTVLVEPDEDRVTLTWTGSLEVAAPYPEEMTRAMRHAVIWPR